MIIYSSEYLPYASTLVLNNPIKHVHLAFKFIIPVPISQIKHGVTKTLNLLIKLKKSFFCFVLIYQEGVHET